jgi:hypothetical protein
LSRFLKPLLLPAMAILMFSCGCTIRESSTTPTSTPTVTASYNIFQLKYRLFYEFDVFWCDPHFWPIVRPDQEKQDALAEFPVIQADNDEFTAIRDYLSLEYKDSEEKVLVYRQHKKLGTAVQMTASGDLYNFTLRDGEGQGWRYEGTITRHGEITVTGKAESINTCPICLTGGTMIDTPGGLIPVEELRSGMLVFTPDGMGNPVAVKITQISRTEVPAGFRVLEITLADGRVITASPGHPTSQGKALDAYLVGEMLDSSAVVRIQNVTYDGGATYDILPDGLSGCYWANGILLGSTLATPLDNR